MWILATKAEKIERVKALGDVVGGVPAWYVSDFSGLSVKQIQDVRRRLRDQGATLSVIKNTLARRAVTDAGLEDAAAALFDGPSAMTVCGEDAVGPARILWELFRQDQRRVVRGGMLDGRVVGPEILEKLSRLPGRDELLAQVVAGVGAPLGGLVYVLEGVLSSLIYALQGRLEQRQGAGS